MVSPVTDTAAASTVRYEIVRPKVARITLARPDTRNAQDTTLLYELNEAFDLAAQDDDVSEGAGFVTGQRIVVDGGRRLGT